MYNSKFFSTYFDLLTMNLYNKNMKRVKMKINQGISTNNNIIKSR